MCREEAWEDFQPQFQRSIDSFQLQKPGKVSMPCAGCHAILSESSERKPASNRFRHLRRQFRDSVRYAAVVLRHRSLITCCAYQKSATVQGYVSPEEQPWRFF